MSHFAASTHTDSQARLAQLTGRYGQTEIERADVIVVLGGDGQMLQAMRDSIRHNLPLFGVNCGRIGFLMNEFGDEALPERIAAADRAELHPLQMAATTLDGERHEALAMNEVALLRQTHNAAHCAIDINDKREMEMLVCDGGSSGHTSRFNRL